MPGLDQSHDTCLASASALSLAPTQPDDDCLLVRVASKSDRSTHLGDMHATDASLPFADPQHRRGFLLTHPFFFHPFHHFQSA